jgi:hypothetical protein
MTLTVTMYHLVLYSSASLAEVIPCPSLLRRQAARYR